MVVGRVQGVFFRATTAERARAAGVTGWVRNRADGSVEAEFQGSSRAVDDVVAWCGSGPPGARVARLDREDVPCILDETDFRVLG